MSPPEETTSLGCEPNPVTEGTVKVGDLDGDCDVDADDRRAADLSSDGMVTSADDHTGDGIVDQADLELDQYAVQATAAAEEALDTGADYTEAEEEAIGATTDAGASEEQAGTLAKTVTAQAMGGVLANTAREEMPVGIFRYDLPEQVRLEDTATVEALISPKVEDEFRRIGEEESESRGVAIEVSNRMAARLIGINFELKPEDVRILALVSAEPAKWIWQVSPSESGRQELLLEIMARISVEGYDTDLVVASSRHDVVVTDPPSQRISRFIGANWEWLWVAILAPLAGGVAVVQKAERLGGRERWGERRVAPRRRPEQFWCGPSDTSDPPRGRGRDASNCPALLAASDYAVGTSTTDNQV